jgi:hypothetical protein
MAAQSRNMIGRWVRTALALAVAGLLALLGGGVMLAVGAPATAGPDQATGSPPAVEDECVPADAWTGYWTGSGESEDPADAAWVTESPGDGWYEVDSRVVTEATEGHWSDLQWHTWTGGPVPEGVTPSVDDPAWNPTSGDPQSENHSVPPRVPGEPYFVSHGDSGNGDWFLWKGTWVDGTDEVLEHLFAYDHPAVTCEEPTEEPTDETEPPEVLPTEATEPVPPSGPDEPADVEVLGAEAAAPAEAPVPTTVDAGVGDPAEGLTAVQRWGTGLMVGGTVLLLAAGGVLAGARTREAA